MAVLDIAALRSLDPAIVSVGSHRGIIQSILDFDYLQGRKEPSVRAIVVSGRKQERYGWGSGHVLVPVFATVDALPQEHRDRANLFINLASGRRVLAETQSII